MVGGTRNIPGETAQFLSALDDCDDSREAFALLQERIRYYQQAGRPAPEPLHRREQRMAMEFVAQSQGR
jgi:hypothetical protein